MIGFGMIAHRTKVLITWVAPALKSSGSTVVVLFAILLYSIFILGQSPIIERLSTTFYSFCFFFFGFVGGGIYSASVYKNRNNIFCTCTAYAYTCIVMRKLPFRPKHQEWLRVTITALLRCLRMSSPLVKKTLNIHISAMTSQLTREAEKRFVILWTGATVAALLQCFLLFWLVGIPVYYTTLICKDYHYRN